MNHHRRQFRLLTGLAFALASWPAAAAEVRFRFELFDVPGATGAIGRDIDDHGDVVGTCRFQGTKPVGFLRRGSTFTLIDAPDSESLNGTQASGLNDAGQVVGRFTVLTPEFTIATHGFTMTDGVLEPFDVPNSVFTEAEDINNHGVIVGRTFLGATYGVASGFTRVDGDYATFQPGDVSGPFGIDFSAVNDAGDTVGVVLDSTGFRAFAIIDGVYSPFSIPGSTLSAASGINDAHQIVGYFIDESGYHGFLMDATGTYRINAPAPASFEDTFVSKINGAGSIVGSTNNRALVGTRCDDERPDCIAATRIADPQIELPLEVGIDIRPGNASNVVHPGRPQLLPVAILGSESLDVREIDRATLVFGPSHAGPAIPSNDGVRDVNRDGFPDLVVHFRLDEAGIAPDDTRACVAGRLLTGARIEGCDGIQIVSPSRSRGSWPIPPVSARGSLDN